MNAPSEFMSGTYLPEEDLQRWLHSCGKSVKVFRGCRIVPPEAVSIGSYSQIDESVMLFSGRRTALGRNVHMAFNSSISGGGECEIGDFASIGTGVRILTGTDTSSGEFLNNPTIPSEFRGVKRSKVYVGAYVTIFTNSIVFPGVRIGEGAIVGAGSLVHRSLKPWVIYAGNPLVAIGRRNREAVIATAKACGERLLDRGATL